jgi:hypothetical protein
MIRRKVALVREQRGEIDVKSPYRSKYAAKANKKRKVVQTPGINSYLAVKTQPA